LELPLFQSDFRSRKLKILTNARRGCRKGPKEWFTGTVWIDEIVAGVAPSRLQVNRVSFEPAARTAWHTHPVGQALHVLTGVGRIQLAGQLVQTIGPGDSVWIEAGERHWHGADAAHTMVHLAMQEANEHGIAVVWLEHVTDQEYSAPSA
jgi:quercetin dioxygenase-like cupin family protein